MTLPAITIRNPWARAVTAGAKRVENRGRPTNYRGPLAIHAGRAPDIGGDRDPRILGLFGNDPRRGAAVGAVVAVAELVDCHLATGPCVNSFVRCGPWGDLDYGDKDAWHLVLDGIRALDRPVPTRGFVRVPWMLPANVEQQVRAQLAAQEVR